MPLRLYWAAAGGGAVGTLSNIPVTANILTIGVSEQAKQTYDQCSKAKTYHFRTV